MQSFNPIMGGAQEDARGSGREKSFEALLARNLWISIPSFEVQGTYSQTIAALVKQT